MRRAPARKPTPLIRRVNQTSGCVLGGDSIYIFVNKVDRCDIRIRFFELDDRGCELWERYADFSPDDVHHQVAIEFRTPSYRDAFIRQSVWVQFQLIRPSDRRTSEPRAFQYQPLLALPPPLAEPVALTPPTRTGAADSTAGGASGGHVREGPTSARATDSSDLAELANPSLSPRQFPDWNEYHSDGCKPRRQGPRRLRPFDPETSIPSSTS